MGIKKSSGVPGLWPAKRKIKCDGLDSSLPCVNNGVVCAATVWVRVDATHLGARKPLE